MKGQTDRQQIECVLELTSSLLREIAKRSPDVGQHTDIEAFILNEINPALVTLRALFEKFPPMLVPAVDRRQCPDTDALVEKLYLTPLRAAGDKKGDQAKSRAAITSLYACFLVMSKHAGALEAELRRLRGLH